MLEIDEDSRLGAEALSLGQRYGAPEIPTDEAIADFYELAVERLTRAGTPRYEISNFARPGFESRHNMKYWLREPYVGFGSDAHSFDGTHRSQNTERAQDYVIDPAPQRSAADPVAERFFLGLRLARGIEPPFAPFESAIGRHLEGGLLQLTENRLHLSARGVLLSNEVFSEFV
jgi:oxygen-independent coproporphyrinogen-3 oxidase